MSSNMLTLHPKTRFHVEAIAKSLPHALIIDGPVGSGVSAVANFIASVQLSPKLIVLPKKKLRGEYSINMEEGNIVVEDIRQLYDYTKTKLSSKHVYIIDTGLRSLTLPAQHAFLKLLEEPNAHVHFIIATHEPSLLLPTVLSRCQRVTLLPITEDQTEEFIDKLDIDDPLYRSQLLFIGAGLPALLSRLTSDRKLFEHRAAIMQDAKGLLQGADYEKLLIINRYKENRHDSLTLLDDMCHLLTIAIRSQHSTNIAKIIDKCLDAKSVILSGGNIRLQLVSIVL